MKNIDLTLLERMANKVDNGGGPPHDGDMESRVAKLEEFVTEARERLVKIDARLDQTSTKADLASGTGDIRSELHKGFNDMIKWVVGTAAVLGAAAITIMTFVLNNATPKAPPAPAAAPIVIQVPSSQMAAPVPAPTQPPPAK